MSRKHYNAIAQILLNWRPENPPAKSYWEMVVHSLSDYFASQNSRFDNKRFLQACGLNFQ